MAAPGLICRLAVPTLERIAFLGFNKIAGIEAFGEPAIEGEQVASLSVVPVLVIQSREAEARTKLDMLERGAVRPLARKYEIQSSCLMQRRHDGDRSYMMTAPLRLQAS